MPTDLTDRSDHVDTRPRRFMVVWQDPQTRTFHHVGRLEFTTEGEFRFTYVPGARLAPRFRPFAAFPDLEHEYRSNELFPFFANRVMSARRPDFDAHLTALGLTREDWTPLELLARSAGERATDTLQVIEEPSEDERDHASVVFPVSGVRHIDGADRRIRDLHQGQELHLRPDPSNQEDHRAVLIDVTTNEPDTCPPTCRPDLPHHEPYRAWLEAARRGDEPLGLSRKPRCSLTRHRSAAPRRAGWTLETAGARRSRTRSKLR